MGRQHVSRWQQMTPRERRDFLLTFFGGIALLLIGVAAPSPLNAGLMLVGFLLIVKA